MEKEHRCAAMEEMGSVAIMLRDKDGDGPYLRMGLTMICMRTPIRFCPFCGEELGAESESERAARLAKAAEIAKPDSNDPNDDPYDRPWDE